MPNRERVTVAGVGMTRFGKYSDRGVRSLAEEAVSDALKDAGVGPKDIEAVFFSNAIAGLITGQEMIRGQVALRNTGILGVPLFNVENACASASSAFHLAWMAIQSGLYDVTLAVGAEKMTHPDKERHLQGDRHRRGFGSNSRTQGSDERRRQEAGNRGRRREEIVLHGYLRGLHARIHEDKRCDRGDLCRRRGEEPRLWRAESQGAVQRSRHARAGPGLARSLGAVDRNDVFADRRRLGSGCPHVGKVCASDWVSRRRSRFAHR